MAHVEKVAIQTNLSCRLDWLEGCDKSKVALWTTYLHSDNILIDEETETLYLIDFLISITPSSQ
ncbi:MAG: hypothetical protein ABFS56_23770 [Pseudomonadota bacterium]